MAVGEMVWLDKRRRVQLDLPWGSAARLLTLLDKAILSPSSPVRSIRDGMDAVMRSGVSIDEPELSDGDEL